MAEDSNPQSGGQAPSDGNAQAAIQAAQRAAIAAQEAAAVAMKAAQALQPGGSEPTPTAPQEAAGRQAPVDEKKEEKPKKRPGWLKPLLIGAAVVLLLIGVPWAFRYWHYSHTHVSTDDAYVTGNLTNVSPSVGGTIQQLFVDEGSYAKQGMLLARLDPSGPQASLRAAQASYRAAQTQIPEAERNLVYQRKSTEAAIDHARAELASQASKTQAAAHQVSLTSGTTQNQVQQAKVQVDQAVAQHAQSLAKVQSARAATGNYRQAITTAMATLENYQHQILTSQKAVQAAQARAQSAQSDLDRAARSEERYRVLYMQDAVAAQDYDTAKAQALSAQALLKSNQAEVEGAESQVEQAKASVKQATSQVEQARQSLAQAQADAVSAQRAADAAGEQIKVQRAGLSVAEANTGQVAIDSANLDAARQQSGQSLADIATAEAGREQVSVRLKQIDTYRAQAAQEEASVTNAQILLNDTYIYAPSDGIVVRKAVDVGASISPGQTILTMSQGEYCWVDANFKETQLDDVVPGEPVELEVDAFPGKVFKGQVHSINEASGAASSLLPPDNATGNFTKVVQRIPVRIEFVPAADSDDKRYARQADIVNLRQGMSVVATIDTSDVDKFRQEDNRRRASVFNGGGFGSGGVASGQPQSPGGRPNSAGSPVNGGGPAAGQAGQADQGGGGRPRPTGAGSTSGGQASGGVGGAPPPTTPPNPGVGYPGAQNPPMQSGPAGGAQPLPGRSGSPVPAPSPTGPSTGPSSSPNSSPAGGSTGGAPVPGAGTGPHGANGTGTGASTGQAQTGGGGSH